jgi:hypothetical protein
VHGQRQRAFCFGENVAFQKPTSNLAIGA